MSPPRRRIQLAEFLKTCRARLQPAEVGLSAPRRSRTPGLRREDVARLAGVSSTWYTYLEQGRDVHPSEKVLENVSRALRLTGAERDYLFTLAQSRPAPLAADAGAGSLSPAVQRMIDGLNVPALVMTRRWDVVAWNAMMARHFRNYAALAPGERNLFKLLMTSPEHLSDPEQYEVMARRLVAKLHLDYSQAPGDPAFDRLIEEMSLTSPIFRELWRSPKVASRSEGMHTVRHPVEGAITVEHTSYLVEGAPSHRLVIYVPRDAESAARMERLAATTRRPAPAEPPHRRLPETA
jgi:transcriptional regulator with XRE-family HTH domain